MDIHSGIILSQASNQPKFAQIIDQIKRLIACGDWVPGFELPSIRNLAAGLKVSVITVKRAYTELETDGIIESHQGKPSIVSINVPDLTLHLKEEEIIALLRKSIEIAIQLGLSSNQLKDTMSSLLGEYYS